MIRFLLLIIATLAIPAFSTAVAAEVSPSLEWIVGHWCNYGDGNTTEEFWLPPAGGVMIGLGRTRTPDRTSGFEYFRIVDRDGVQSFVAQPGGRPPTSFQRTESGDHWVRFENPDHDFPQRIEYRREGNSLRAMVSGPGDDGEETVLGFDYTPCAPGSEANSDIDAIKALRAASNQAIARHDIDDVISFLNEDFVITVSTGFIVHSRDAMAEDFTQHFAEYPDVVYVRTPSDVTISEAYPLAIENGTWVGTRTDKNGPLENGGQYTASWKKVDGVWKIQSELFVGLYCNGADC
jgi:ketosteroid isomerase-like protein